MGHVDHGKTTLLDAIRNAKVVETEAGGITQHIGAYQVAVDGRKVTFLDTPGHEAFTAMRARGAKVTDIAVLVVAADDGVMPQTKESISHARAAEVPIVVAVNKIDLPDANPDRVLGELAAEGLQPEEWGGDTQVARVSARQQTGLDELLEKVLLVADAELELQANPKAEASGPIIESRLDVGRGPVATMLVQRGTLKVGDAVVAGDAWGKVRALHNYKGDKLKDAKPGDPVEILGFDKPPPAGELARVVENDRDARDLAQKRAERLRREQFAIRPTSGVSLESLFEQLQAGEVKDLNIVVKGDVQGSVEAIVSELAKIQHAEVRVNVIHQGVGGITENDINARRRVRTGWSSASTSGRTPRRGRSPSARASRSAPTTSSTSSPRTSSRRSSACSRRSRPRRRSARPRCARPSAPRASARSPAAWSRAASSAAARTSASIRDSTVVYTTTIDSLKRFQDDVREVQEGFECGLHLANYDDVKVGDVLEVFETREIERTSLDALQGQPRPALARLPAEASSAGSPACEGCGGRAADPQPRAVLDVRHRAVLAADQAAEGRDGGAGDVEDRLLDRRQRRVGPAHRLDPVEADDRDVLGHAQARARSPRAARRSPSGRSSRSRRSAGSVFSSSARIAVRPPSTPNSAWATRPFGATPAASSASSRPAAFSRVGRKRSGPATKPIRSWPRSSRCWVAIWPAARSSTPTCGTSSDSTAPFTKTIRAPWPSSRA